MARISMCRWLALLPWSADPLALFNLLRSHFVWVFAVMVVAVGPASAQTQVTDFAAAPGPGAYAFASSTPRSLSVAFRGESAPPATIVGHLFLPRGTTTVGAVVLMDGSGGLRATTLNFWAKTFSEAGIAVFAIDSFGPRGVQSVVEDQTRVPVAADIADAFAALKVLATHPRIDRNRIAIMGFSRGGMNAWRTAIERVIAAQHLPDGLRFAAHIPVYAGSCTGELRVQVRPGIFSPAPMLWIHGDADDWTPIAGCIQYAEQIRAAGTPVEFISVAGARHGFDDDDTKRYYLRTAQRYTENCPIEYDIETLTPFDRFTGKRIASEDFRNVLMSRCVEVGATVEGDRSARAVAADKAVSFLRRALKT